MTDAKKKASAEIKAYKDRIKVEREIAGERALLDLGEQLKRRKKP